MAEETLEVGVNKLLGIRPYDGPENTSRDCPYFQKSLDEKFGNRAVQQEIFLQVGARL